MPDSDPDSETVPMPSSAIAVFTGKSAQNILQVGGSGSWVVGEKQAKRREYLVCIRNASEVDFPNSEPHGAAFLVGKISGLVHDGYDGKNHARYIIKISEYALTSLPARWGPWRNPVKYTTLEDLKIDLAGLDFRLVRPSAGSGETLKPAEGWTPRPLTIAQAKQGLALQFDVPLTAIDILIKG